MGETTSTKASVLHADQADILSRFGKLEQLIEGSRTFITPLDFPTERDKQRQQTDLLQRTRELLGEERVVGRNHV